MLGIQIYRYLPGFLHQKVFVVDDRFAAVGTANFDNRSCRLNFEVTALLEDRGFATEVHRMLENDFARSKIMAAKDVLEKPRWFKLVSRACYLAAPIQ